MRSVELELDLKRKNLENALHTLKMFTKAVPWAVTWARLSGKAKVLYVVFRLALFNKVSRSKH